MPTVVTLTCPVCGAPLTPSAESCGFCGSFIFIKSDLPKLNRQSLNQAVIQEHITEFRKRVRRNQYDEEAHYGLGLAYFNLGLLDASEEELTQSARLMPENPHIQAQLAVVIRDQIRNGDTHLRDRLRRQIGIVLKLDPHNIEALSLQAEELALDGQEGQALAIVERIRQLDGARAGDVLESIKIANIERHLGENDWDEARPLLQDLSQTNASETKRLIGGFLAVGRDEFPLQLVNPNVREAANGSVRKVGCGGVLSGLLFLFVTTQFDGNGLLVLLALSTIFILPRFAMKKFQSITAEKERTSAIEITDDFLDVSSTDMRTLISKADALDRYFKGELGDLKQLGPLELNRKLLR